MGELKTFLRTQMQEGKHIYPAPEHIFAALNATPFDRVKVVILGQDPYHGPGQAHGFCFSVPQSVDMPPSLRNIYKEIQEDIGTPPPPHGNLEHWADQGVLLLNAVLTVEAGKAASHAGRGWETFTDAAVKALSEEREDIVFLLWGRYAQEKGSIIDPNKHFILKAAHPSPLSAHNGFFGCRHFSHTNDILKKLGKDPIEW